MVSVGWPGATPDELQRQVVDRLENASEVENLYRIGKPRCRPADLHCRVEFHDYTPQAKVQPALFYEVRKRMQDEARLLPAGVIGPLVNDDDFSDVYFKLVAVTAPGMPMRERLARLSRSVTGCGGWKVVTRRCCWVSPAASRCSRIRPCAVAELGAGAAGRCSRRLTPATGCCRPDGWKPLARAVPAAGQRSVRPGATGCGADPGW